MGVVKFKHTTWDPVAITSVIPGHSDKYDPTDVDQLVLCISRSGAYACCGDEVLKEIMMQMAINSHVSVRSITTLLQKALPERKDIDRHIINNVQIRARKKVRIRF